MNFGDRRRTMRCGVYALIWKQLVPKELGLQRLADPPRSGMQRNRPCGLLGAPSEQWTKEVADEKGANLQMKKLRRPIYPWRKLIGMRIAFRTMNCRAHSQAFR
jgi:hypothetical protein